LINIKHKEYSSNYSNNINITINSISKIKKKSDSSYNLNNYKESKNISKSKKLLNSHLSKINGY